MAGRIAGMIDQPQNELRCPTCGARQGRTDTCRRCKSDLRFLRAALEAYDRHRRDSLNDLELGEPDSALRHARRCHELRPGTESRRLMAVCQLLRGDWSDAVDLVRSVEDRKMESDTERKGSTTLSP
jgi:hypothetical protein